MRKRRLEQLRIAFRVTSVATCILAIILLYNIFQLESSRLMTPMQDYLFIASTAVILPLSSMPTLQRRGYGDLTFSFVMAILCAEIVASESTLTALNITSSYVTPVRFTSCPGLRPFSHSTRGGSTA